ncbi:MAG: ABC transporter substrate-binding protein [Oscillospiraceae bacterium]|nr:ABC transporter substrate-binding protein [Oscillospiraceae bacterium]
MQYKRVCAFILAVVMSLSLAACGGGGGAATTQAATTAAAATAAATTAAATEAATTLAEPVEIITWGINPVQVGSGNEGMINAFNEAHPHIKLIPQSTPGTDTASYATQDISKLLAAIAAGTPPDVTWLDRFTVSQFASRDALTPITEYVNNSDLDLADFREYAVWEITFDNQIWALPWATDVRIMYWNKDIFEEEGFDPEVPPQTWEELIDFGLRMTKYDDAGNITRIGYTPRYASSWLYLYGFQTESQWLSEDGKTALINAAEPLKALEFMVRAMDNIGGAETVMALSGSFLSGADHPFLNDQLAMFITDTSMNTNIVRYKPEMNFGTAPVPVPEDGASPKSYGGGWSYCIPKGAANPELSFEVMKWLITEGIIVQQAGVAAFSKEEYGIDVHLPPFSAYLPTLDRLKEIYIDPITIPNVIQALKTTEDAMGYSTCRPVSPVGEIIFTEMNRATERALYHELTPQEALDEANVIIQTELDKFWDSIS